MPELDNFTRAYIMTALWSSTENPYGTCPKCGAENRLLCRWEEMDDSRTHRCVCMSCSEKESDHEPPMEDHYSIEDFAPETLTKIIIDCAKFQEENGALFTEENCLKYGPDCDGPTERAGHDFWLTRNGHGAGFWDGDWAEPAATTLTNASKAFSEVNLYAGDDGRIYA